MTSSEKPIDYDESQMKEVIPSLHHLHGNPFAALDVETTGRIGGWHEIVQIAIVPINMDLEVAEGVTPFYSNMRPNYPERVERGALRTHGLSLDDLLLNAPTQERVLDYLLEWFAGLPLGFNRLLTPIAHNWAFERGFLIPWLGPDLFSSLFSVLPRDTMTLALSINDRCSMIGAPVPFEYVNLRAMCNYLGIEYHGAHDALADSLATAKLYSHLMRMSF